MVEGLESLEIGDEMSRESLEQLLCSVSGVFLFLMVLFLTYVNLLASRWIFLEK
jgi:hypothetical protein